MPKTRLKLDFITLVSIDGRQSSFHTEMAQKALVYSMQQIDFQSSKLITPKAPRQLAHGIEHCIIPPIESHGAYSRFILKELTKYINTSHCLIVQADGFITNPKAWDPEFAAFDYIGAPWPETTAQRLGADYTIHDLSEKNRVGNGGFSLRSKRILEACASIDESLYSNFPEDFVICRLLYDYFTSKGLTFAPLSIASRFALELPIRETSFDVHSTFGFHGRHFKPENLLMARP